MEKAYRALRFVPIYFVFITTFGLAAGSKWMGGGVPPYFEKQFADTFLNAFPGALAINFYFIALLETLVTVAFVISIFKREFLKPALLASSFVFGILGFGLRVSHDYAQAGQLFCYFTGTLAVLIFVVIDSAFGASEA
jgi:hypothetical protein